MLSPEIVMLIVYFGSLLFLIAERCFQLLIECWMNVRRPKNNRIRPDYSDNWDWLRELENQPIEVTFDHKTFLVYDRKTELWHLEERESPADFIDSLFGDYSENEFELIESTPFYNAYAPRKHRGLGIHSPTGGWENEKFNHF